MRCWAEGLDLAEAWNRYLYVDGAGDARRARGELTRLLDELRALARAHGRADLAVLLRRDPEAMPQPVAQELSLEEFRARQPADFYGEAELTALYEAEVGGAGTAALQRKRRLRARLVQALGDLARLGAREPLPGDELAAWLDERVVARLAAAGLASLADLMARIGSRGDPWHRGIHRLGPAGARRLERWLREHEASLGSLPSPALASLASRGLVTPAPPRCAIVPLERFAPLAALDGSAGLNRAPRERCKLAAANDLEAIHAWLRLRLAGSHTWRAYRKEAERFLLWAVLERGKALSSLDGDDCVAYRDFLAAPGARWTGPRHSPRWSEAWRPFEGALSRRSASGAITVLRSLCEWLVRRHYLDSNPWDDVPERPAADAMPQLRALSQQQWSHVQYWLAALPPSPAAGRLHFVVDFAYRTGLRLSELAAARVAWLRHEPIEGGDETDPAHWAWSLMVLGKRRKWREVPLADAAVGSLRRHFAERGLTTDLLGNEPETPLIARLSGDAPLSAARIYEVLAEAFEQCAADVAGRDARAAARIRQATTHWLRHTHGSHAAARGVPQDVLQANLGHESLATTSIYVKAEKRRRHLAVQAAFGGSPTGAGNPVASVDD